MRGTSDPLFAGLATGTDFLDLRFEMCRVAW
jgi:hypothetical protein